LRIKNRWLSHLGRVVLKKWFQQPQPLITVGRPLESVIKILIYTFINIRRATLVPQVRKTETGSGDSQEVFYFVYEGIKKLLTRLIFNRPVIRQVNESGWILEKGSN
jgi:hypothetical protein